VKNIFPIIKQVKNRVGELWWNTFILFFAQQLGALVNVFVGLWLVPKYVPKEELGAVLPLMAVGTMLGLPLTILMMPFLKFLTKYMARGEDGKVKKLLRDVLVLSLSVSVAVSVIAYYLMPFIFVRMRVENGWLTMLIVCAGVLGALSPVFGTTLQALKKFKMISILGFLSVLVRLVTLWVALPFRGLSGYFVGQITPLCFGMAASLIVLRKHLDRTVKMVSYWEEDWRPIIKFTSWSALFYVAGQIVLTTEGFVIRHRLPDMESAGYYMISRFAEISFYISSACAVVLFPLISEQHEQGQAETHRLAVQSTLISFVAGTLAALAITFVVFLLFHALPAWKIYSPFVPYVLPLCLVHVIRGTAYNMASYKLARNDFGFIKWFVLCFGLETVLLYGLTGYEFFTPWMSPAWKQWFLNINPCRLSVVLGVILLHSLVLASYVSSFVVRNYCLSRASLKRTI
jgi:O-antigen/teichoic acid export membrane protein